MSDVVISVDMTGVRNLFAGFDRDMPFLTAAALTATAQEVQKAEVEKMKDVFDRPTPWTVDSVYIVPAKKADTMPTAIVAFKDDAGKGKLPAYKYLAAEIEGGARKYKSHELALIAAGVMHSGEYAVPGEGVVLDEYGNMPGALIETILTQLGASERVAGHTSNMSLNRSRKRNIRRAGGRFFLMRRNSGARDGIYFEPTPRVIFPFIIFVSTPGYGERFPAYETATEVVERTFTLKFMDVFTKYVAGGADGSGAGM